MMWKERPHWGRLVARPWETSGDSTISALAVALDGLTSILDQLNVLLGEQAPLSSDIPRTQQPEAVWRRENPVLLRTAH